MSFKCPICKIAGLPDYRVHHTVCPQCDSDLKPYLILNAIGKSSNTKNKIRVVLIIALGLGMVALGFVFSHNNNITNHKINTAQQEITTLQDSIETLQLTITESPVGTTHTIDKKEVIVTYIVRKGDTPSKIAGYFYNDWKMYTKIETDNSLNPPYLLQIGQPLTIKLTED